MILVILQGYLKVLSHLIDLSATAVRDRTEALVRHLADSLTLLPVIEHHVLHTATGRQPQQPQQQLQQTPTTSVHASSPSLPSLADSSQALRVIDVGTGEGSEFKKRGDVWMEQDGGGLVGASRWRWN